MTEDAKQEKAEKKAGLSQPVCLVLDGETFRQQKDRFPHSKELLHSLGSIRYCKGELYKDCALGMIRVPQKSAQRTPEFTFAFLLTAESLVLIEETGNIKACLDKQGDGAKPGEILFQLLEDFIADDIFYLAHLEKELEDLADALTQGMPKDFFVTLTQHRQKLSEFNAYYEQLTAIGEMMQSYAGLSLPEPAEIWRSYAQRTEHLQQHVHLLQENVIQLRELYQAQQDAKQNRVIGVLTVVTTLFLPLSLLTSWYGMNFSHMPELTWAYGYKVVIAVAVGIVILEILFFKKKKFF